MKKVVMFIIGAVMAFGCFAIGWYWGFHEGNASFEKASIGHVKSEYLDKVKEQNPLENGFMWYIIDNHLEFAQRRHEDEFIKKMDDEANKIGEVVSRDEHRYYNCLIRDVDVLYEIVVGDPVYIDGKSMVPVDVYYADFDKGLCNERESGGIIWREWRPV